MDDPFQQPQQQCDLVMKGGITSGVVYPPAILELARDYRFRSIGGTSAGAIAAAVTAAAEYGRKTGSFTRLKAVSDQIASEGFVLNLFQPDRSTRPLMQTLFALVDENKREKPWRYLRLLLRLTRALVINTPQAFVSGALLGLVVVFLLIVLVGGGINVVAVLLLLVAAWLTGLALGIYALSDILLHELPNRSFFGLCPGHCEHAPANAPLALTDWLNATINNLAGREATAPPLTFRELADHREDGQDYSIDLRMVTTNLSQESPYVLPFTANTFLFKASDMQALFPQNVVDHLIEHAHTIPAISLEQLPGYYWLPKEGDLPIVVATRMSLSFPLLISAVPLYSVRRVAFRRHVEGQSLVLTTDDLQQNWFSDGGICSNFPIHFFDAWLPTRPTFGINLVSLDSEMFERQNKQWISTEFQSILSLDRPDQEQTDPLAGKRSELRRRIEHAVHMPRADQLLTPQWKEVNDLLTFIRAVFGSAQNYRDTQQSILPSYRERIVQINFARGEGGLNLAMKPQTIEAIQNKGRRAGELMRGFNFRHHQWVRMIVLMALMERQLKSLEQAIQVIDFEQLMQAQLDSQQQANLRASFPYPQPQEWTDEALQRINALRQLVTEWHRQEWLVENPPIPRPVLRVTPEL